MSLFIVQLCSKLMYKTIIFGYMYRYVNDNNVYYRVRIYNYVYNDICKHLFLFLPYIVYIKIVTNNLHFLAHDWLNW